MARGDEDGVGNRGGLLSRREEQEDEDCCWMAILVDPIGIDAHNWLMGTVRFCFKKVTLAEFISSPMSFIHSW